eukprot:1691111-Pleurochrysis_carterae.AAC.1
MGKRNKLKAYMSRAQHQHAGARKTRSDMLTQHHTSRDRKATNREDIRERSVSTPSPLLTYSVQFVVVQAQVESELCTVCTEVTATCVTTGTLCLVHVVTTRRSTTADPTRRRLRRHYRFTVTSSISGEHDRPSCQHGNCALWKRVIVGAGLDPL